MRLVVSGYGVMTRGLLPHLTAVAGWSVDLVSRHLTRSPRPNVTMVELSDIDDRAPDVILGCFESDTRSQEWWRSPEVRAAVARTGAICVELSTLSHSWILQWHRDISVLGGVAVETPVTGSRPGAESASLSLFVHATEKDPRIDELLAVIGSHRYDFRVAGHPTAFKLIYNAWGATILHTLGTYLPPLQATLGTDFGTAAAILRSDGWMAPVCAGKLDRALSGDYSDPDFTLELMMKDLGYAQDLIGADETLSLVRRIHTETAARVGTGADYSAVTGYLRHKG